jgi:hypothetical protein
MNALGSLEHIDARGYFRCDVQQWRAAHTFHCSGKMPMSAAIIALLRAHPLRPIIAPRP